MEKNDNKKNELVKFIEEMKLEVKILWKQFLYGSVSFILNIFLILFERIPQALGELISGKVLIPVLFFWLSTKIKFEGVDSTINMIMQISTFATTAGGALVYKFKKDTTRFLKEDVY